MITEFEIGGIKYTVEYVDDIDDKGLGRCYGALSLIKIANNWHGKKIPESVKEQTLCHEIIHAILDEMGRGDLSGSEEFVQGFACLLHQFQNTKK